MSDLSKQFFDRYYPVSHREVRKPPTDMTARATPLLGHYWPTRRMRGSLMKVGSLVETAHLLLAADGALVVAIPNAPVRRFVEVAPLLFVQEAGDARLTVRTTPSGQVQYLFIDAGSFEPVPWYGWPALHRGLLAGMGGFFALSALGWWLGGLSRWWAKAPPSPVRPAARWVAGTVCLLQAVGIGALFVYLSNADVYDLVRHLPPRLTALLVLPLLSLVLTLALPYFAVKGFNRAVQAPLAILHYRCLVGLAFLALAVEWYWNLLGFHY